MTTTAGTYASWMLSQETRALLDRLERVKPFVLQETMVPAAALSLAAQAAVEGYLLRGRRALRDDVRAYLAWLEGEGRQAAAEEAQRRFTLVKLRFTTALSQFDIFSEAMSQRSEVDTGVWLSGLDIVAQDALALPGLAVPPVVCYLARGPGAAIRRARTRLPGGGENPVALVRLPRERMIGSGLASSLVHEVGHQGAALLDLVRALRSAIQETRREAADEAAWRSWARWISEIVADLWAVAKLGVTATTGLMSVVSLPRAFVFRPNDDDPHPTPWIRVKLSAALGDRLYPHPQWRRLSSLWQELYPTGELAEERRAELAALERNIPRLVELLWGHRVAALGGHPLSGVLATPERQPARLAELYRAWRARRELMHRAPPSLVFAVIGQARCDGTITPEEEGALLAHMLKRWAVASALELTTRSAGTPTAADATARPKRHAAM